MNFEDVIPDPGKDSPLLAPTEPEVRMFRLMNWELGYLIYVESLPPHERAAAVNRVDKIVREMLP